MAGKRKDKNGKALEKNESQRPNGLYQYSYTDPYSKERKYLYAKTLEKDKIIVVNVSGRGDKDVAAIARYRGVQIYE